jgi:NCS1 family nucleobase:cation symporter-1
MIRARIASLVKRSLREEPMDVEKKLRDLGIETPDNRAFRIEQRGIDFVPEDQRTMTPRELTGLWAGAIWNVEYVVFGALVVYVFGLSLPQAILVILGGNLCFFLSGVASIPGARAGTATLVVSRAPYGILGARGVAFFNWVIMVGFEVTGLSLIVFASEALGGKAGFHPGTPLKVVFVVLAVALQALLPALGHATMVKVIKYLAFPFIVLFAILACYTLPKAHTTGSHGASWQLVFVALALVFSAGGFSWPTGSDYARYMPRTIRASKIVGPVVLGSALPAAVLMLLGATLATVVPTASTAVDGATAVLPGALAVIYLVLVIVQLFAINTLDLYSSGLSLQATGLRVSRYHAILIDTGLCLIFTFLAVFSAAFSTVLADFLLFILIFLAPFLAIYVVDWWLRRQGYLVDDLQRRSGGAYWFNGGWNLAGVAAQLLGMVAAAMFIDTTPWVGPGSSWLGGADFSTFAGAIIGGGAYYVFYKISQRRAGLGAASAEAAPASSAEA